MDPYLSILKQCTEDPLLETIVELEQQLEDMVNAARDLVTTDTIRDAVFAEETKLVVAGPSQKWTRQEKRVEGQILGMGNPNQDHPSPPCRKHTQRVAPAGVLRKTVCVRHTAVPCSAAPSLVLKFL